VPLMAISSSSSVPVSVTTASIDAIAVVYLKLRDGINVLKSKTKPLKVAPPLDKAVPHRPQCSLCPLDFDFDERLQMKMCKMWQQPHWTLAKIGCRKYQKWCVLEESGLRWGTNMFLK
jgi:hypothetical protein